MDDIIVNVTFEPEIVTTGPGGLPSTITWPDILDVPSILNQIAQNTLEGYLTVDSNGDLVVAAGSGGVTSWNDLTDRPPQLTQLASLTNEGIIAIDSNGDLYVTAQASSDWADITNKPLVFPSSWTLVADKPLVFPSDIANVSGLSTALAAKLETEIDPVFSASAAAGITSTNISNWNTAYSWGDHSTQGYAVAADVTAALDDKQDTLVSGTNIKSINGQSILAAGDLNLQAWVVEDIVNPFDPLGAPITAEVDAQGPLFTGWKFFDASVAFASAVGIGGQQSWLDGSVLLPNAVASFSDGLATVYIKPMGASDPQDLVTWGQVSTALAAKQDALVSGTNIKTINGESILGSGDLVIAGGGGSAHNAWEVVTTNTTLAKNKKYLIKAAVTVTLPSNMNTGDEIAIAAFFPTTVARDGNTIAGLAEDLTLEAGESVYLAASAAHTLEVV